MKHFNRQYALLSILVIGGLGGSFYSSFGGDPVIGAFSAGITVGVLVAFYMLRMAEIRSLHPENEFLMEESDAEIDLWEDADPAGDFGKQDQFDQSPSTGSELLARAAGQAVDPGNSSSYQDVTVEIASQESVVSQPQTEEGPNAAPTEPQVSGVSLETETEPTRAAVAVLEPAEQTIDGISVCSCVCGCSLRSISGSNELCGNCERWWLQQSEKCICDYDEVNHCVCGSIQHGEPLSIG